MPVYSEHVDPVILLCLELRFWMLPEKCTSNKWIIVFHHLLCISRSVNVDNLAADSVLRQEFAST